MSFLDSEQNVDLNLETKEPLKVEIKIGHKVVFVSMLIATTILLVKLKPKGKKR